MAAKLVINNIFLNSICYHYCYNLPTESVKKLNMTYRRMLSSQARTKAWCERSSMDEKLHFFNAIGLNIGLSIFPDKIKSGVSLKEILNKYENEKIAAAQNEQASLGCYVITDRESAFLLGQMGMTINHETYIKSLDYNKTGFSIKNWGKRLDSPIQKEMEDVSESVKTVCNTILNTGLTFDSVKELFEINAIEMKILLFLYQRVQAYIFRDDIVDNFTGYITKARASRGIKKLILNGYLDKHQNWQTYQYRISTKGINTVSDFINRIVKANSF